MVKEAASYRGRLGESADTLLAYLRRYDAIGTHLNTLAN